MIVAAVKASRGEDYQYPFTIRFVSSTPAISFPPAAGAPPSRPFPALRGAATMGMEGSPPGGGGSDPTPTPQTIEKSRETTGTDEKTKRLHTVGFRTFLLVTWVHLRDS